MEEREGQGRRECSGKRERERERESSGLFLWIFFSSFSGVKKAEGVVVCYQEHNDPGLK